MLNAKLKELYDILNELLIGHGILPILQKEMSVVRTEGDFYDDEEDEEASSEDKA